MNRKMKFSLAGAAVALIATVALAAGFDQINSGYLKIGNGAASTKTLEFNVGNTTNDPIITGDSSNNLNISAAATRFLERPANGVNYVELNVPASMSGNVAFTLPTTAAASNGAVLTATTGGVMSFVSPLPLANGGTNATSKSGAFDSLSPMTTAGDVIYGGTSGTGTRLGAGSATTLLHSGTTPSWSAVSMTADVTGTLPLANGGTNATSKSGAFDSLSPMTTSGDVIVGGASGTGTRAACATTNTVLHGGTPPACSAVVSADISGAIAISHGGTGQTTQTAGYDALSPLTTLGDIVYGGASGTGTRLAGNTVATRRFLTQTGTGTISAVPAWGAVSSADLSGLTMNGGFIQGASEITSSILFDSNVYTAKDSSLSIENAADTTKIAKFSSAGITTGTTRTLTLPNATTTLAGLGLAQSFTANQTINASGGVGLTVNGVSGQYTQTTGNGAAAGSSYGHLIQAGGNSSDYSLLVENRTGSDLFRVRGDGAVTIVSTAGLGNVPHGTNIVSASCPGDADGVCVVNCSGTDGLVGGGCTTSSGSFIKMFPNSSTQWKCEQATTGSNIVAYGICVSY